MPTIKNNIKDKKYDIWNKYTIDVCIRMLYEEKNTKEDLFLNFKYKEKNMEKALQFFEEITKIPRCSGSEKAISEYLVVFAKKRKLSVHQDKSLNIIIKKLVNFSLY